jgi:rRNA biogenesis protein RRP5
MFPHVLALDIPKTGSGQYPLDALPMGFIVEAAKVIQVVEQQGVYVDIGIDGVTGFVHVSSSVFRSNSPDFEALG